MSQFDYSVSKKVGRYIGPVFVILFLSEIATLRMYETAASPHIVYLNGFVLLLFGFYLVTVHNVWTKRWPILITISAWGATLLGSFRLFFPTASQAPVTTSTYVMLAIFTIVGAFIALKSYQK